DEGSPLTIAYENVDGSFKEKTTVLPDIINGSFATGDYDNDGDPDVLLSGMSGTSISKLYKNNGNFSFSLVYSFPGLVNATMSWIDLDNDNDLDFLLAGTNSGDQSTKTYVYENKAGAFVLLSNTNLPTCTQCSMDWADSNGDGKIDLLISGLGDLPHTETALYLNNGDKTFTKGQSSVLKDLFNGDVGWGDFDNDEDMDALISGFSNDGLAYALVYENNNGVLKERTDIDITGVAENWYGGTAWADFNNDGYLDILVTGRGISQTVVSYNFKVFLNGGQGKFTEAFDATFPGMNESSVDYGDYDGDGDLDISFLGITSMKVVTGVYENKFDEIHPPNTNTPPTFTISETIVANEDFQTFTVQPEPAAVPPLEETQIVVYSLELLGDDKVSALINPATGKITFAALPNAFGNTSYKVTANDGQLVNNLFSTTIEINVIPVNDAPELSVFEDVEIEPNSANFAIPFTVQDIDHSTSTLVVTATSSNNAVVSNSKITISGDGQERTLNIVPEDGAFGETMITVTVNDGTSNVEYQFKITIPH
ncbi:MAG: hypothetical protein C0490_20950, partial [Marivirga sp.]|nr:hypothetical protein [Marivirga sp.]